MENEQETGTPGETVNNRKNLFVTAWQRVPKKIILLLAGVVAIVLFFLLPANSVWLKDRPRSYWSDFLVQRKQLSLEQRKIKRFETGYTYSRYIAGFFEKKGIKEDVLVLVPSEAYFKKQGITYPVPEPVAFYYFTNLKTISPNSPKASSANWYVRAYQKQFVMDSVANSNVFKDTINALKK
jgi:hypothetical protein